MVSTDSLVDAYSFFSLIGVGLETVPRRPFFVQGESNRSPLEISSTVCCLEAMQTLAVKKCHWN